MDGSGTNGQDAHEQCLAVKAALAALPRWQRLALVQRRYQVLTYAEIAANLRCSPAEARASVYAALRALRDHVGTVP